MGKIKETDLREYAEAGAITAARIIRTDEGWILTINLNWKPGDFTLYSTRNHPRAWASLDRMLTYIKEVCPKLEQIELLPGDSKN